MSDDGLRQRIKRRISVRGAISNKGLAQRAADLKKELQKSEAEDVQTIERMVADAKEMVEELRRLKVIG
jgi:hypothetical protein